MLHIHTHCFYTGSKLPCGHSKLPCGTFRHRVRPRCHGCNAATQAAARCLNKPFTVSIAVRNCHVARFAHPSTPHKRGFGGTWATAYSKYIYILYIYIIVIKIIPYFLLAKFKSTSSVGLSQTRLPTRPTPFHPLPESEPRWAAPRNAWLRPQMRSIGMIKQGRIEKSRFIWPKQFRSWAWLKNGDFNWKTGLKHQSEDLTRQDGSSCKEKTGTWIKDIRIRTHASMSKDEWFSQAKLGMSSENCDFNKWKSTDKGHTFDQHKGGWRQHNEYLIKTYQNISRQKWRLHQPKKNESLQNCGYAVLCALQSDWFCLT